MDDLERLFKKNIMECKLGDYNETQMIEYLVTLKNLYSIGFTDINYNNIIPSLLYSVFDNWQPSFYTDVNTIEKEENTNYTKLWWNGNYTTVIYNITDSDNITYQIDTALTYGSDDNDTLKSKLMDSILASIFNLENPFLKIAIDIITKKFIEEYLDPNEITELLLNASKNILF